MDTFRFDDLTRLLGRSAARRRLLLGLAGSAVGLATRSASGHAARKKRKKKARPAPKPNTFGCLNVGATCKNEDQCCSGVCERAGGKKTCRAHDVSICTPQHYFCTSGVQAVCNLANVRSVCVLTTGKGAFCGDFTDSSGEAICRDCARDTDCEEEFGPGAACIDFRVGLCGRADICANTGGTACVASAAPSAA